MLFQNGNLTTTVRQRITAACRTPTVQKFFHGRHAHPKFFCDFGLCVVAVILVKPDYTGAEIV